MPPKKEVKEKAVKGDEGETNVESTLMGSRRRELTRGRFKLTEEDCVAVYENRESISGHPLPLRHLSKPLQHSLERSAH